ncbi:YjgF/Yer057p/UK114 family [Penicillium italicum]|uniref:YjgF/Yer057p/UK114 family n=1 Tax=Penicillium italicum TaxID=40296 RepID=A0A0A2KQL2_PENIT|nr:YjgF/Yer057p/UK114 family [Penicillium italicum]
MTLTARLRTANEEKLSFEIPRACPGNSMTSLTNSFVGAIKRSTDLRYNLWWSFGLFLEDVPRRLGSNEALDRAVDAVTTVHAGFCTRQPVSAEALTKYSYALKTLRVYLDDPLQASASSTLCAVMILLICQTFIGNSGQMMSGHAQGAANILHARKNFGPRDEFERKLFLSLRGSVLFESLYNDAIDLSPEEWDTLVKNDFDQDQPEGQILRCLAHAPGLIKRGKRAMRDGEDLTPLAIEVRPIYEKCKLLLGELKARTVEFKKSELSSMTETFMARILRAHYLRTYGIGLAITTVFNCFLQTLDPLDYDCWIESRGLVKDTLVHAQESNVYRPVGAGYVIMCLSAAWAVTADPQLRSMVEVALIDYHGDFMTQDGVNIPRELERARVKNVLLPNPVFLVNGFVFVSGQVAAESNGKFLPVEASVTEKPHKMIQNVKITLESSESSLDQGIKANITKSNSRFNLTIINFQ